MALTKRLFTSHRQFTFDLFPIKTHILCNERSSADSLCLAKNHGKKWKQKEFPVRLGQDISCCQQFQLDSRCSLQQYRHLSQFYWTPPPFFFLQWDRKKSTQGDATRVPSQIIYKLTAHQVHPCLSECGGQGEHGMTISRSYSRQAVDSLCETIISLVGHRHGITASRSHNCYTEVTENHFQILSS